MPAINVFDFTQKIKNYVGNAHKDWSINSILVFYSTRSKPTPFGYKVTPLYVGVTAKDMTKNCGTNCRIKFDELCKILDPISCCSIVPYIIVSTGAKEHRAIFDTGVTYLKIECTKSGSYKGHPYVRHHTERIDIKPHFERLNESVLQTIKERLKEHHQSDMKQMNSQFREIIAFDYDDDDHEMQPEDYDYNKCISVSCDVGGYRD